MLTCATTSTKTLTVTQCLLTGRTLRLMDRRRFRRSSASGATSAAGSSRRWRKMTKVPVRRHLRRTPRQVADKKAMAEQTFPKIAPRKGRVVQTLPTQVWSPGTGKTSQRVLDLEKFSTISRGVGYKPDRDRGTTLAGRPESWPTVLWTSTYTPGGEFISDWPRWTEG